MFLVNVIVVAPKEEQTQQALNAVEDLCTHIAGDVYFMEGDLDTLTDEGVLLNKRGEAVVPCLGGLSQEELVELCINRAYLNPLKIKYSEVPKTHVSWSEPRLTGDCPHCGAYQNLFEQLRDKDYPFEPLRSYSEDECEGVEFTCEDCNKEFELELIEY